MPSIFRVNGGTRFLQNIGNYLPDYTFLHPRRQKSPSFQMILILYFMIFLTKISTLLTLTILYLFRPYRLPHDNILVLNWNPSSHLSYRHLCALQYGASFVIKLWVHKIKYLLFSFLIHILSSFNFFITPFITVRNIYFLPFIFIFNLYAKLTSLTFHSVSPDVLAEQQFSSNIYKI
jgi:hypothetical protein